MWGYADDCAFRVVLEVDGVAIPSYKEDNWAKQHINTDFESSVIWDTFGHIDFVCYSMEICCERYGYRRLNQNCDRTL